MIDWTETYQPRMEVRANLGLTPEENLNAKAPEQKKACDELRVKNTAAIDDGMEELKTAIELRPRLR